MTKSIEKWLLKAKTVAKARNHLQDLSIIEQYKQ